MKKYILPSQDFVRIFQTIHGILLCEERDLLKSCLFFAITGSEILKVHYGLNANPIAGRAVYNLDKFNEVVLAFTDEINSNTPIQDNPFHCWIEAEGWFIDFTSPLFPEMLSFGNIAHKCRRKMFQKPLHEASGTIFELNTTGSFYFNPDPFLCTELIGGCTSDQYFVDLQQICVGWYKRPPHKMIETIRISNGRGNVKPATRTPITIEGIW